ncbi:unnamed protein product [Pseudo-nitzschia multistriata]|uniref:Uncharacterized protein n=1 Tax=Pseudo-nitzschia multistriata TaxID=183589 RepID=A0A448ZRB9_9STRA|nr:unnamed protein product [Pseudo-nitzschia multistriata]
MGSSSSKTEAQNKNSKCQDDFGTKVRNAVNDEIARRAMMQREIQMAVNIARTRDILCVFGTAWGFLTAGVVTAKALGKKVPPVAGVPIVVGGLVLGNFYDLAYGNKLQRVVKEAEHILEHERGRFVPFKQAPFSKFYTDEERAALFESASAVGDLFPNSFYAPRQGLPPPPTPSGKE